MNDTRDPAPEAPQMPSGRAAVSEEDHTAQSTPVHNLIGAAVMGAVALVAIVMSLTMENPSDGVMTSPALLPFLVGATLLAMSIGLAWNGARRGGIGSVFDWCAGRNRRIAVGAEGRRTLVLMILVAAYIQALDLFYFQWTAVLGETRLQWGSFEAWSTVFLALVLRVFWRGPWTGCLGFSVVFATALAGVFRYGFNIPVPGSG